MESGHFDPLIVVVPAAVDVLPLLGQTAAAAGDNNDTGNPVVLAAAEYDFVVLVGCLPPQLVVVHTGSDTHKDTDTFCCMGRTGACTGTEEEVIVVARALGQNQQLRLQLLAEFLLLLEMIVVVAAAPHVPFFLCRLCGSRIFFFPLQIL